MQIASCLAMTFMRGFLVPNLFVLCSDLVRTIAVPSSDKSEQTPNKVRRKHEEDPKQTVSCILNLVPCPFGFPSRSLRRCAVHNSTERTLLILSVPFCSL
jgi:hypothetical protein